MTRPTPPPRLLLVHAHPDDESLFTGGVIAAYLRRGVRVRVLTCTLGEEGEVIGDEFAGLVASRADQLGGYRVGELAAALRALGPGVAPEFLGGAGRWRDSGMAGTPAARNPRAFVNASPAEAVAALVKVVLDFQPGVVVTYDPGGTYGHPDHVAVHRVATAAVAEAARRGWDVPKTYWCVTAAGPLARAAAAFGTLPDGWRPPGPGDWAGHPDGMVTAAVDISGVLDAKRAALRAHATQVQVSPDGSAFALSNQIAYPILDREHFVLARGTPGPAGADGWEPDLFA